MTIQKVTLIIGGTKIECTLEEAKKLRSDLDAAFGVNSSSGWPVYVYPNPYTSFPSYPYCGEHTTVLC